jgi:hypothetical protein
MEAVHVLHGRDRLDHAALVDLVGQRELDEDPGDALVGVQLVDEGEELILGDRSGRLVVKRLDPDLRAGLPLAAHVDRRRRILAHEDGRQPDGPAELADLFCDLCAHARGEGLAVHERRGHGGGRYTVATPPSCGSAGRRPGR